MNKTMISCLAAGATGLLFLGATTTSGRKQYTRNTDVEKSSYLVVTGPAGEYIIDRDDVVSLSAHTYEVDGVMRVWEVTISEKSANTIRYYYTKAIPVEKAKAGTAEEDNEGGKLKTPDGKPPAQKAAPETTESVLNVPVRKSYPETTHAHTIEFRVKELQDLDAIYAYFSLMVYGWSPQNERPAEAREFRNHHLIESGRDWSDWTNTKDH